MTFVSEIVSEGDIQKYGLDDLLREWNDWSWREGRPVGFIHTWAANRATGTFLVKVKHLHESGPSGRPEPSNKSVWVLNWRGHPITVKLNRAQGSSMSLSDVPFVIAWELLDIDLGGRPDLQREQVIAVLKQALQAFGHDGGLTQLPNAVVRFEF